MDLLLIPTESRVSYEAKVKAKEMKKLHAYIREHIEKANVVYKVRANKHRKHLGFKLGDVIWLHLRKERFSPRGRIS